MSQSKTNSTSTDVSNEPVTIRPMSLGHSASVGDWRQDRLLADLLVIKATTTDIERRKISVRALEATFVAAFPVGTSVVVDLVSLTFVTGTSPVAALKLFLKSFGQAAPGWSFEIGRPTTIGGGIPWK